MKFRAISIFHLCRWIFLKWYQQVIDGLLLRPFRGREGVAGEKVAVDHEHPLAVIGYRRGQLCEQVGIPVEPALDIPLGGLHTVIRLFLLPDDIAAVSP